MRLLDLLLPSTLETLYMVCLSILFTILFGLPIGILLVVTEERNIMPNKFINTILSWIVNIGRSVPFVILMIAVTPFTRFIVGTSIGTNAAIVPLIFASIPFFARIVESSLKELSPGIIEAAHAMGTPPKLIILKVMLPESLSQLILGTTITVIAQIGYSAMAGIIGGGGLGDLAIRFGYQRSQNDVLFASVIVLICLVMLIQFLGNKLSNYYNKK
ncbi:methionine ABC transporter permease [Oceanirhabdus sp. W0125-5]|uniref:methionine ABC transporter permease n=1 Tax=Oceanirhabdus sp. W0125-5 TaxID=2999116 RepID=UPI0022F32AA7|nr:methionine ABC transporter permease [Oceanirhabdus sp. W0125-5]WBW99652.1 ABC transporter permease [Oceanirhabdus sp. W0125-5]